MRRVLACCFMSLAAVVSVAAQDTAHGQKVYAAQKCSVCHSIAGHGNAKGKLDDVGSKLTAAASVGKPFCPKKHTGLPTVSYEEAVQEALCFGWIDSLVKSIDDRFHMQMFTPRKPKSAWSATNKARLAKLIKAGAMANLVMTHKEIASLAALPGRDELLGRLLGTMQAPVANFVRTLNEVPTRFVRGLAAIRDQKQAA